VLTNKCAREDGMRNDVLAEIFRKSLLTRIFEDRFVKLAMEGGVPPLLHPGAGQEVAQIAAITALNDDDPVLYAHRGVGYMIARGVSLQAMLADCAGR
jgi:pyruvate dehydrogenase E1 component alpha subunit